MKLFRVFVTSTLPIIVSFSGCLQNFKYRDCPALNQPLPGQWQPVELGSTLVFTQDDPQRVYDSHVTTSRTQYFASRTLDNGQTYTDVIEFTGSGFPPDPNFIQYSLGGLLIARNVGLIQISRNDGNVYTIVPE